MALIPHPGVRMFLSLLATVAALLAGLLLLANLLMSGAYAGRVPSGDAAMGLVIPFFCAVGAAVLLLAATGDGLPKEMGKMGISVSRANPNRVFAIVLAEKSKAGLYRSDDGGKKWNLFSSDQNITARSWYYMEVFADPVNADIVYVLNAPMMRSIDGGRTFANIRVGHGDTHDLWISTKNNQNLALADDGGGQITYNAGRTWSPINNQATSQFYRVNRPFLINRAAWKEVHQYFNGKLLLKIPPEPKEKIIVSREKTRQFKMWVTT